MTVQQYIHQLNNSELGRTGVHESYVSVPRGIVPKLNFVVAGNISAKYKRNGAAYNLKFKKYDNGEFRLTGLGELYRVSNVNAGDLIILEDIDGSFGIDFVCRSNLIVFGAQGQYRFECRNEDRLTSFLDVDIPCCSDGKMTVLRIVHKGSVKPRADSPRVVNVYELQVNGVAMTCTRNQAVNFFSFHEGHFLVPSSPDVIRKLEWSDYE